MAHFPMFIPLRDREVIVVGHGPHAAGKIQKLAPFGPRIRQVEALNAADLTPPPALVILAGPDRSAAELCKAANVPVNSVDDPENCTFYFPSIVRRGELTVGISSGGTAPAASVVIRQQIEAALPENLEAIFPWLSQLTARLRREIQDYDRRAAVLRQITRASFKKNRPLSEDELAEYLK